MSGQQPERRHAYAHHQRLGRESRGEEFVTLDGANHILLAEPAWPRFLDEIETFLAADPT